MEAQKDFITNASHELETPFPARTESSVSDAHWEISEPLFSLAQAK